MTHADYIDALGRILEISRHDPELDTPEANELEVLVGQVIAYEREHFPELFTPLTDTPGGTA